MNKKLVLLGATLLMTAASASAQKRVTGRVVDAAGEPVIGASVRVEGGKGVAVTDDNGNFTLANVPASAKHLLISYIGKETKTVSVAGNVNVVLVDDDKVLDEAVVVGYGSARKVGTVVGSVSSLGGEKMEAVATPNAIDALQGQVSGLQVFTNSGDPAAALTEGAGFSSYIRGVGSLNSGNTPLFVVDGVPTSASILGMMNPNDVERVTVLKGASATSIYGSRASNGVIYVTTKKGRSNEKATVTVSQSIGWSGLARRIGNPMTASELLDIQREVGFISGADYAAAKAAGVNTDFQKYSFRDDAAMYQTNFAIRGGNDRTTYYTSASYLKQDGIERGTDFKRITFRSNIDSKPLTWLSYGANINLSYDDRQGSDNTKNGSNYLAGGIFRTILTDPNVNPYGENGERLDQYNTPTGPTYSPEYIAKYNPLKNNDIRALGSAYLEIKPIEGLTVRSQLGMDALESRGTRKMLPSHASADGYGAVSESYSRSSVFSITNTAEYQFTIGDDHSLTLLAGQEGIVGSAQSFSAATRGQNNDLITELGNGLETTSLPTSSRSKYQYLSFFGRADYGYADKYFLNLTVRNDQSSRFGKNHKGATFVSGGLMWNMKAENFLQDAYWLSDLRLRADIGSTGNSSIGNYDHLSLVGNSQYGGNYGYYLGSVANEDLTWEKQLQTSVGAEATFMDRYTVSLTWYNRVTDDMLMDVPVAYTTGFASVMRNIGKMTNTGIELEVSADLLKTQDYYLNVRANYSYNKNKIDRLFDGLDQWIYPGTGIIYKVGSAVEYYYPIFAGVDKETGEQMWYKQGHQGDPVHEFNPETMTKEFNEDALSQRTGKKRYAPHHGGFGLTAGWKGLSLSADFSYVLGKYMLNNDAFFSNNPIVFITQGVNQDKDVMSMWRQPGDLTLQPAYGSERQFDTHLLENASFLRLKNLSLAYDLPKSWLAATRFVKGVKVNATARNLFTVTKYKGADPEINTNVTLGAYPNTRQYTLGLEVTF